MNNQFENFPLKKEPNNLVREAKFITEKLFNSRLEGEENLKSIPTGRPIIFMTTHLSNNDVPLAVASLGKYFPNLTVAHSSTHQKFSNNSGAYLLLHIGGLENFFPIKFNGGRGEGKGSFRPDNYEHMRDSLEGGVPDKSGKPQEGRPIIVASHYTPNNKSGEWKLPPQGGIGGPYLAQITKNVVIVPVAIEIKSDKPFGLKTNDIGMLAKRTLGRKTLEATVHVGKMMEPKKIEGIERLGDLVRKREKGVKMSAEELARIKELYKKLSDESDRVLDAQAALLPEKTRGERASLAKPSI